MPAIELTEQPLDLEDLKSMPFKVLMNLADDETKKALKQRAISMIITLVKFDHRLTHSQLSEVLEFLMSKEEYAKYFKSEIETLAENILNK